MADLDRLRDLNNSYGHLAGDAVIKKVAQILQASVRENDVVARFGGEEYGILLPDTTAEEAYLQVEAMRKAIEAAEFSVGTHEAPIKATMSFGITERSGTELDMKAFLHQADVAVYHAKHIGRNCVCVYRPEMNSFSVARGRVIVGMASMRAASTRCATAETLPTFAQQADGAQAAATQPQTVAPVAASAGTPAAASAATSTDRKIDFFIKAMVAGAICLVGLISALSWPLPAVDWTSLVVFLILALILEIIALEVYSSDTSVSMSVVPVVVTAVTQLRHRKPLNRLVFNMTNHLIGASLSLVPLQFAPQPFFAWPMWLQMGYTLLAAAIIYASTTVLLATVISLASGQPFRLVWQERFKWLGLYYLALGLVAYVLLFSYYAVGVVSIIMFAVPFGMIYLSQRQYLKATKSMLDQLHKSNDILSKQAEEVQRLNDELLLALARTIDLRDPFVVEHSRHVARYSALVATELGLPPTQVQRIYQAGLMHDIGKLAIPEAILFKPERLTQEEYEVIKDHVTVGADLLDDFQSLQHIAIFVRAHHERYDGRGYPDGLVGEQIPIEARILALADAVEAMASDRPYRQGSSPASILQEIQDKAGTQFDPKVVDAFVRIVQSQGDSIITNSARTLEILDDEHGITLRERLTH